MGTRAIIYTRVSTDPMARGRSVSEQEVECRAVCDREGWTVERVFTDNDRSASRFATKVRPEFRRLLAAIEAGACDVVVTWESSRLQRDVGVYADLRAVLLANGVHWSYGGRVFDMSKARDRKETARDALDAEGASDETSERVQRSVRANAAAGRPHGKLLYGYQREYDPTTKALVRQVEHPEQAAVVRECGRRIAHGEALYAIAADLNSREDTPAPRGGRWEPTQIRRLCMNPAYIARRVHRGEEIGDAIWPPLLDAATFYACVARLTDPARRTNEGRGARHLLSGIARCGKEGCGAAMRVLNNRTCLAYQCSAKFCTSRRQDAVDGLVRGMIIARLEQPDLLDLLAPSDDSDETAASARAEAQEKRARLNGFYDAAAAGEVTPQALARIEARLLPEIEDAERRAHRVGTSPLLGEVTGTDAAERWETLSLEQQRELITLLCTVTVLPFGRGRRTFDPESVLVEFRGQR